MPTPPLRNRLLLASSTLVVLAGLALVSEWDGSDSPLGVQRRAGAEFTSTAETPFPGLFSLGSIRLQPGAVIDAWDSPIRDFLQGHSPDSGKAQVRSIGSINLEFAAPSLPTVIVGNAIPTHGSQAHVQRGSFVTGSIAPSSDATPLPRIPGYSKVDTHDFTLASGQTSTEGERLSFDHVHISGQATWTLRGPICVQATELEIQDEATLIVDASQGPVIVQVTERWAMGPTSRLICETSTPGQVLFLIGEGQASASKRAQDDSERNQLAAMRARLAGESTQEESADTNAARFDLRCSGQFNGLLYAPFSQVTIPTGLRFRGTITAESIELEAGTHVTCDPRALRVWESLTTNTSD